MVSSCLYVSGNSQFSVKLARARALTMLLQGVTTIDNETCSFVVGHGSDCRHNDLQSSFIDWCDHVTCNKDNSVQLELREFYPVDFNKSEKRLLQTEIA